MKNRKVILLSGYARGGTNIIWNILQSHPDIVAPLHETGEIFKKIPIYPLFRMLPQLGRISAVREGVDRMLYRYKMENFEHQDNRYHSENVVYTKEQVNDAALCLKSVNNDIRLTAFLAGMYPDLYFIGLTRNGYALADGYIRRGRNARAAGRLYRCIANRMKKCTASITRSKIVKFEDALRDTFGIARELFDFVDVSPPDLEKLRLKSKRVISKTGEHNAAYGDEKRKYWFTRENIGEILKSDINRKQSARLSDEERNAFNREAAPALEYYGYEVLR